LSAALLLALLLSLGAGAVPLPGPEVVPTLNPNCPGFPASTFADCSDLLEAPAGRHGFAFAGSDGHFRYEDGIRARFFGINVAKDAVFQPPEVIDAAVAAIARAGFNLVRLHHVDDENGLLPAARAGEAERIDPGKLASLDYWIAALKARGIYIYLDLLDYRTFREAEGVPGGATLGRGAKPYAVFSERLLERQREYAHALLFSHVNPLTKLSYAADPAVCMVELCDENGLFHELNALPRLVEPYRSELLRRWNFWLVSRYGSRDALAEAWTGPGGASALRREEDPRTESVGLPGVTPGCEQSTARLASRAMLFADVHRDYFRSMVADLRSRGLRCPVSAVTSPEDIPDLWASAQDLDFVATNYYWDHPYYRPGHEWQLPAFLSGENVLRDRHGQSFAPRCAAARVLGKPLVMREWGGCWPNESRGPAMLEATAYACLQDVDAMILFTLDTRPGATKLDFFDARRDPTRWGLASLCARAFLGRQVQAGTRSVAVAYSPADIFYPGGSLTSVALHQAGAVTRMATAFCGEECGSLADVTVASGRTSATGFTGDATVISGGRGATDAYGHGASSAAARSGFPGPVGTVSNLAFRFGGTLYSSGVRRIPGDQQVWATSALAGSPGWRPIGTSEDGRWCLGFREAARGRYVFGRLGDELRLRAALDALQQVCGAGAGHQQVDRRNYGSDTGELVVDRSEGLLWVVTPQLLALAGELGGVGAISAGGLQVETRSRMAACVWQARDGLPLGRSVRWTLKLVTVTRNTGQKVRDHLRKPGQVILALDDAGQAPVTCGGRASKAPTVVSLGGKVALRAGMVDGTLELSREGDRLRLYCDTPGITLEVPGTRQPRALKADGTVLPLAGEGAGFTWPAGADLVQMTPAGQGVQE
jgi:hypothetical protein